MEIVLWLISVVISASVVYIATENVWVTTGFALGMLFVNVWSQFEKFHRITYDVIDSVIWTTIIWLIGFYIGKLVFHLW